MEIDIVQADLGDPGHARGLVEILDSYARDRMGGERPLPHAVRERLAPELAALAARRPTLESAC